MINIGKYIEMAINWLTDHFASFFDALSIGIGGFIDGFQHVLFGIPFYITILALAILAWFKAGKGVAVFTLSGLLLVYGMGFWEETMQTLALVLSSTCRACCWEYRWEFGRQTVTVVIKSCGLFWILCRRCLPLFI